MLKKKGYLFFFLAAAFLIPSQLINGKNIASAASPNGAPNCCV